MRRATISRPPAARPASPPKPSLTMLYASGAAFLQMQKLNRIAQDAKLRRLLRAEPSERTVDDIKYLQRWVDSRLSQRTRSSAVRADVLPRAIRYVSLSKGEPLFAQHEINNRFYILMRGSVSNYEVLDEAEATPEQLAEAAQTYQPPPPNQEPEDAEAEQQRQLSLAEAMLEKQRLRRDAVLAQLVPHHKKELAAREYQEPVNARKAAAASSVQRPRETLKQHKMKQDLQASAFAGVAASTKRMPAAKSGPRPSEQKAAATTLQKAQRARAARAEPLAERVQAMILQERAALIVQLAVRRLKARRELSKRSRKAASKQSYEARKQQQQGGAGAGDNGQQQQEERAAKVLQAGQRGALARKEAAQQGRAATMLQSGVRRRMAHKSFAHVVKAVLKVESFARSRQARREMERKHIAAAHLQAIVRKRTTWRLMKLIKEERGRGSGKTRFLFFPVAASSSFGEASLLFGEAHRYSAIADEPTELAYVERDEYLAVLQADKISNRISFLASLPALKESAATFSESLPALASALISSNPKHGDHVSLALHGAKMLLVEHGEVSVRWEKRPHQPLLVLGPGSFYGASALARRLDASKEIRLTAETACTALWVHPTLVAARLGGGCVEKIIQQEEASLDAARAREPIKAIKRMSAIEREEREEREDAHFRTRNTPLSWESAKLKKPLLVTSVSLIRKTGNHRGLRNIFLEPDQMRPEDLEVKRPPLPKSGDPDALVRPSTALPSLPSPWGSPRSTPSKTMHDLTPSWSRPRTIGAHAAAHPPPTMGTRSLSVATLIRPGSAVVRSSSDFLLIEDNHGRWKSLDRRGRRLIA